MIKTLIFVLSIMTNEGELKSSAFPIDKCPDTTLFSQSMEKMRKDGEFIDWSAMCIDPEILLKQKDFSND